MGGDRRARRCAGLSRTSEHHSAGARRTATARLSRREHFCHSVELLGTAGLILLAPVAALRLPRSPGGISQPYAALTWDHG